MPGRRREGFKVSVWGVVSPDARVLRRDREDFKYSAHGVSLHALVLGRRRVGFEFSVWGMVCLDRLMLGRHREGFEVSVWSVVCLDCLVLGRRREGFEVSVRRVVCLDRLVLGRRREGFEFSVWRVVCLRRAWCWGGTGKASKSLFGVWYAWTRLVLGRHWEGFEFSARSVVGLDRLVLGPRSKILKFKLQRFLLRRLQIRPAQPLRFHWRVNGVPALPRVLDKADFLGFSYGLRLGRGQHNARRLLELLQFGRTVDFNQKMNNEIAP